jgi:hypothetical protein
LDYISRERLPCKWLIFLAATLLKNGLRALTDHGIIPIGLQLTWTNITRLKAIFKIQIGKHIWLIETEWHGSLLPIDLCLYRHTRLYSSICSPSEYNIGSPSKHSIGSPRKHSIGSPRKHSIGRELSSMMAADGQCRLNMGGK